MDETGRGSSLRHRFVFQQGFGTGVMEGIGASIMMPGAPRVTERSSVLQARNPAAGGMAMSCTLPKRR